MDIMRSVTTSMTLISPLVLYLRDGKTSKIRSPFPTTIYFFYIYIINYGPSLSKILLFRYSPDCIETTYLYVSPQ